MKTYIYYFAGWYYSDRMSQLKGPFRTREEAEEAAREASCNRS
jgi:hypothetical protein